MKLITLGEINQDYKDKLLLFLDKEVDQVHFEVFEEPLTEESVIQHNHGCFYRCYKFQEWRYSLFLSISKNKYFRWGTEPYKWTIPVGQRSHYIEYFQRKSVIITHQISKVDFLIDLKNYISHLPGEQDLQHILEEFLNLFHIDCDWTQFGELSFYRTYPWGTLINSVEHNWCDFSLSVEIQERVNSFFQHHNIIDSSSKRIFLYRIKHLVLDIIDHDPFLEYNKRLFVGALIQEREEVVKEFFEKREYYNTRSIFGWQSIVEDTDIKLLDNLQFLLTHYINLTKVIEDFVNYIPEEIL